jgi:ATP-dependent DNA ligase
VKRKAILQKELGRTERVVYCQHVGENGEKLFMAAEQLGLEGVIGYCSRISRDAVQERRRGRSPAKRARNRRSQISGAA